MVIEDIPRRVFLDTSILNFILDKGEYIFDAVTPSSSLTKRQHQDIDALYNIFLTGERASWQLAISPFTYKEVISTQNTKQQYYLRNWFQEVWHYWLGILEQANNLPSFIEAEHERIKLLSSDLLDVLPDIEDRILMCDAIVYRCDCFCTRDWKTILKHRNCLESLPIRIITPTEWWRSIQPYAGLWA